MCINRWRAAIRVALSPNHPSLPSGHVCKDLHRYLETIASIPFYWWMTDTKKLQSLPEPHCSPPFSGARLSQKVIDTWLSVEHALEQVFLFCFRQPGTRIYNMAHPAKWKCCILAWSKVIASSCISGNVDNVDCHWQTYTVCYIYMYIWNKIIKWFKRDTGARGEHHVQQV